jgi:hypothetical protein
MLTLDTIRPNCLKRTMNDSFPPLFKALSALLHNPCKPARRYTFSYQTSANQPLFSKLVTKPCQNSHTARRPAFLKAFQLL